MEMKKAGQKMSLMMGLSMSFILSMTGLLSSGQFTLRSFLMNFILSFAVSMILGIFIPMRKISDSLVGRFGLQRGTLKTRLFETLVSDLMYTPVMTFVMVFLAWSNATSHGAKIPFLPMILRSEIVSLIVAYFLIFLLTPVFMKIAFGSAVPGRKE